jgi:hypothetical protein
MAVLYRSVIRVVLKIEKLLLGKSKLQLSAGSAPYAQGVSKCSGDGDCIKGSNCNNDNGLCFWDVPVPTTGVYRLDKDGGTSNISFPILSNDVVWSGNIRACVNGTCDSTADVCDKEGCSVKRPSPVTLVCTACISREV